MSDARAFSYVRFSTPEQAKGDSLRRQTEDTERWCEKNAIPLDTSLSLRDLGVSAFKGNHRSDKAALGRFLEAVKGGKVPRGSFLVIENLDRLSREEERTALRLWLDILDQGVNIVQLHPETVFRHERSDMTDIIRAIIELSRGHSESRMKSHRLNKAWEEKRKQARTAGKAMSRQLPAWVELKNGRMQLVPHKAAAVRRVFQLATAGYGHTAIIRKLTAEKVVPIGESKHWCRSYLHNILSDRRVIGEYQPKVNHGRKREGEPIKGYFPAVVTEADFYAVRAATVRRTKHNKTRTKHVNIFSGLVRHAKDGDVFYATTRTNGQQTTRKRVLITSKSVNALGVCVSFPYDPFERAILTHLAEIDPKEVVGTEADPDEVATAEGELQWIRERADTLKAELLTGEVAAVTAVLRDLEARERELQAKIERAKAEAAKPKGESWDEARSIIADMADATGTPREKLRTVLRALEDASDKVDARVRLQAAIRRVVETITILIRPVGRVRHCIAQIAFVSGQIRTYMISYDPPKNNGVVSSPERFLSVSFDQTSRQADMRTKQGTAEMQLLIDALDWKPAPDPS
jgi:DNA invertase Pin-like site-specific DNA recombinase